MAGAVARARHAYLSPRRKREIAGNHSKSLDGGLPMFCARMIPRWLAACSFLALGACGSSGPQLNLGNEPAVPVPPNYGLYAYDGDKLIRLDGDGNWERSTWSDRSDLPPKIEFVVFNRSLTTDPTPLQNLIELRRVAHVRNDVRGNGNVVPAQSNRWAAPDLPDYRVALNFTPVPGHSDVVVAAPSDPLAQGLYSFSLQTRPQPLDSRVGVGWSDVDQNQYALAHCVDDYPTGYRQCAESDGRANDPAAADATQAPPAAPSSQASMTVAAVPGTNAALASLTVRDLRSSRTTVAGSRTLVVEGNIVNTSTDLRTVPSQLVLSLLRADGTVVQTVAIADLPPAVLAPGDSYHFRSEVADPPADAVRVRVTPAG
jgi:hypothetical protein